MVEKDILSSFHSLVMWGLQHPPGSRQWEDPEFLLQDDRWDWPQFIWLQSFWAQLLKFFFTHVQYMLASMIAHRHGDLSSFQMLNENHRLIKLESFWYSLWFEILHKNASSLFFKKHFCTCNLECIACNASEQFVHARR